MVIIKVEEDFLINYISGKPLLAPYSIIYNGKTLLINKALINTRINGSIFLSKIFVKKLIKEFNIK